MIAGKRNGKMLKKVALLLKQCSEKEGWGGGGVVDGRVSRVGESFSLAHF